MIKNIAIILMAPFIIFLLLILLFAIIYPLFSGDIILMAVSVMGIMFMVGAFIYFWDA